MRVMILRKPCIALILVGCTLTMSATTFGWYLHSAWTGASHRALLFDEAISEMGGKTNPDVAAEAVQRYAKRAVVALRDYGYINHLLIVDAEIHR